MEENKMFTIENINKEREHVEKLLYSKFNFFILFFTLFLGLEITAATTNTISCEIIRCLLLSFLLIISIIISVGISCTLFRGKKILENILNYRDNHDKFAKELKMKIGRGCTNVIMFSVIPIFCTCTLAIIPLGYIIFYLVQKCQ